MAQYCPHPTRTARRLVRPEKTISRTAPIYDIKVELDDANQKIIGSETVTYHNNSADDLPFIWLQLDQNHFAKGSIGSITRTGDSPASGLSMNQLTNLNSPSRTNLDPKKKYGYTIIAVKDAKSGTGLKYTINQTMMRIDLPAPLKPGGSYSFNVDWNYFVNRILRTEWHGILSERWQL